MCSSPTILCFSMSPWGVDRKTQLSFSFAIVSTIPPATKRTMMLKIPTPELFVTCVTNPMRNGPRIAANFPNML